MPQNKKYPVVTIQCDWNDVLRLPNGQAWISTKYLNENSTHGQLISKLSDNKIKVTASKAYQVISHSNSCIVVKDVKSDLTVAFVACAKPFRVHKKGVYSISAAENAFAVSSCEGGQLCVWDSRTGETLLNLTGHGGPVYKCRFFPSGVVIVTAGADGSLRIWSAENGICPVTLKGHKMAVNDVAIVDKGRNIVSASKDGKAKLWDVGESRCLDDVLSADGAINCCCLVERAETHSANNEREIGTANKLLIVGTECGFVQSAIVATRETKYRHHIGSAVNCCTNIDNERVAIGCDDGRIIVLSVGTGETVFTWHESASPVLSMVTLPQMAFIAGRQDGTCTMHSLQDPHRNIRVQLTGSDCEGIRDLSYNGRWVFVASRDCNVRKYDSNQLMIHFK